MHRILNFNYLLIGTNLLLLLLSFYLVTINNYNAYADVYTVLIVTVCCIVIFVFLYYNVNRKDPFILLFSTYFSLFYVLRVASIQLFSFSDVSTVANLSDTSINRSLIYILFANTAILLGIAAAKARKVSHSKKLINSQPVQPKVIAFMLATTIILTFITMLDNVGVLGRIYNYLMLYALNYITIILIALVYLTATKHVPRKWKATIYAIVIFYLFMHTTGGSKGGAFFHVFVLIFISQLVVRQRISFSKKSMLLLVALIPILVLSFSLGSFGRTYSASYSGNMQTIQYKYSLIKSYLNSNIDAFSSLPFLFSRVGYLDHTARLMQNRDQYQEVIAIDYYWKSIIDNVFTPWTDIYDAPLASQSLRSIDNGLKPTMFSSRYTYQSTLFTVYGEYYVLFGPYLSIILLFATAYLFKYIYYFIDTNNDLITYLLRAAILYMFFIWLKSFGLDWSVRVLFNTFVPILIFTVIVAKGIDTSKI